ncbi:maltokinase N-terminal cap-like domain-containing protein [Nocardioides limicola]|uniref:maltokinase N-terminal cap-like domain-containing protein n=1 Tax=Nocardioides limicola TaxID=2803368 RepID=UPI00193C6AD4|nr:hypothetical protein [Nocardioides sp. DJM-14]
MAILHRATMKPPKLALLADWLPDQPWLSADVVGEPRLVASYRFDDPAGEVGMEGMILDVAGERIHGAFTYRGAPLAQAEDFLVGTTEHSVLGTRWVYDAAGDPVFTAELTRVIRTGGTQAEQFVATPGGLEPRPTTAHVRGSGGTAGVLPVLVRRLDHHPEPDESCPRLTGTWEGQDEPVLLAYLSTDPDVD